MNLANQLTVLRILIVPGLVAGFFYFDPADAVQRFSLLGVFVLACLTDAADGYVARRFHQQTAVGSLIDPIADKALLSSAFLCLTFLPQLPDPMRLPVWLTIVVLARDLIIVTGTALIFAMTGSLRAQPLLIGKITTCLQMATVIACLGGASGAALIALSVVTAAFTILSGLRYIQAGTRLLPSDGNRP